MKGGSIRAETALVTRRPGKLPQLEFLDLAAGGARKLADELQPFRHVGPRHLLRDEIVEHVAEREGEAVPQLHERAGPLAEPLVGIADDGDLLDGGMLEQQTLDLDDRDVLAAADDDVLRAARDADVAVVIQAREIA